MKPILAFVVFVAAFAYLQAKPTDSSSATYEEGLKKVADYLEELTKKMESGTGIHSEFDKEKFLKAGKGLIEKLTEAQTKLKEAIDSNFKNVPGAEDLKKKAEEVQKQITESLKTLNSPDLQKSADKFRETLIDSSKKVQQALTDVAQKMGVAPSAGMQKSMTELSDEFNKSLKTFQEKIQKIIEEASNELKKKKA